MKKNQRFKKWVVIEVLKWIDYLETRVDKAEGVSELEDQTKQNTENNHRNIKGWKTQKCG